MVRKIKISNVIESQETPGEGAPPTTPEPAPPTTPEPEEHVKTPTEVAVFETTHEPPPDAANLESTAAAVEPPTPKPKRPPRKKKETTVVPTVEPDPPAPEVEHPAEEIKITAKARAKPRAKPKAKTVSTSEFPTHDDEGQRIRPPPSTDKPTRPETPEQFWNSTLKNMKEKKDRQYASLIQSAF